MVTRAKSGATSYLSNKQVVSVSMANLSSQETTKQKNIVEYTDRSRILKSLKFMTAQLPFHFFQICSNTYGLIFVVLSTIN